VGALPSGYSPFGVLTLVSALAGVLRYTGEYGPLYCSLRVVPLLSYNTIFRNPRLLPPQRVTILSCAPDHFSIGAVISETPTRIGLVSLEAVGHFAITTKKETRLGTVPNAH
jgi:hypothetical protein